MSDISQRNLRQRNNNQDAMRAEQSLDFFRRTQRIQFDDQENLQQKRHKGCILLIGLIGSLLFLVYSVTSKGKISQNSNQPSNQLNEPTISYPVLNITYVEKQSTQKLSGTELYQQYRNNTMLYGHSFDIPKIVWIFDNEEESTLIQRLNIKNTKRYAEEEGYVVNIITLGNYQKYMDFQQREEVDYYINIAKGRKEVFYFPGQNKQYVKQLIVLALLQQEGGIYIDSSLTLTESLNWIQIVHQQHYVNVIDKKAPPQFFGFHNVRKGLLPTKIYKKATSKGDWRVVKPAIQPYFMATYPRTKFITELNSHYKALMNKTHSQIFPSLFQFVTEWNERIFRLDHSIRGNLFQVASLLTLSDKQKEYDIYGGPDKLYAIDFYGVKTINQNYFPRKIQSILDERTIEYTYYHMTRVQAKELLMMTGPLRFMVYLAPHQRYESLIEKSYRGDPDWPIYKGSFLEKHLFNALDKYEVLQWPLKKPAIFNQWASLPKKVWVYWGTGIQKSTITHQLCTRNIHDLANKSGFEYHELNRHNLEDYLDNQTISNFTEIFDNSPHNPPEQVFSDFVRLNILKKYGGVYMDASFLLLQNMGWLVNITKQLPDLIYNRYGKHPKVFMFYNPQYGNAMTESIKYDNKYNTKAGWHIAYQNNFIAAQKGAELIKDWLNQFTLYHTLQYSRIKPIHDQCGLGKHAWTHDKSSYLFQMDAVKCVIGRKEKELQKNGSTAVSPGTKYYKLWSMNGYFGVQKFRSFANIENIDSQDNYILTHNSLSDVEDIIGQPYKLVKFYGMESKLLSFFLFRRFQDINPESLVALKMLPYKSQNETIGITREVPILIQQHTS